MPSNVEYGLTQTAAPAEEPLTLAEAKAHLHVDGTDEDDLITALIPAAREYCEAETHRQFVTATWQYTLDKFPSGRYGRDVHRGVIRLPRPTLISITSIAYTDIDGNSQPLSSSLYDKDITRIVGRIMPAFEQTWPSTRREANAVVVTYTAGYGAASAVPDGLKSAMYLVIGDLYEHGSLGTELRVTPNPTFDRVLAKYAVPEAA